MFVRLYTKPGCPLCEEARELLDEAREKIPFELEELNIRTDSALFDRYRHRVPVIRIGNIDVLELKFTLDQLLEVLQ